MQYSPIAIVVLLITSEVLTREEDVNQMMDGNIWELMDQEDWLNQMVVDRAEDLNLSPESNDISSLSEVNPMGDEQSLGVDRSGKFRPLTKIRGKGGKGGKGKGKGKGKGTGKGKGKGTGKGKGQSFFSPFDISDIIPDRIDYGDVGTSETEEEDY